MQFLTDKSNAKQDALVLPFWHSKRPEPAFTQKALLKQVLPALKVEDFSGKVEELLCLYPAHGKEKRILLIGLGEEKALTHERLRRAYAQVARFLQGKKVKSVRLLIPHLQTANREFLFSALIEGLLLANYAFDAYKSNQKSILLEKIFLQESREADLALCKKLSTIASAVYFARDLVIGNADDVTPAYLVKQAHKLAKAFPKIEVHVLDRQKIEKEKLGLLAAVSRSSSVEPALILIQYRGNPASSEMSALVGKGITFDTGGLLIKPRGGMETMRDDMAGAAVVLGTLHAAAALKMKVNLVGVIAATENAIGPTSYKPGDVYPSHSGINVEIADTDAEGRLVLADAISYVQSHFSLKRMIDIATLTGGAIIALGEEVAALCCNDEELAKQLTEAGESTYERLWRLPLYEEYQDLLKSKCADIKNAGARKASTICGAIFLQKFVKKEIAWAHLDIAGVAFPETQKPYQPVQATGFGVRLLISFLDKLNESKA